MNTEPFVAPEVSCELCGYVSHETRIGKRLMLLHLATDHPVECEAALGETAEDVAREMAVKLRADYEAATS